MWGQKLFNTNFNIGTLVVFAEAALSIAIKMNVIKSEIKRNNTIIIILHKELQKLR